MLRNGRFTMSETSRGYGHVNLFWSGVWGTPEARIVQLCMPTGSQYQRSVWAPFPYPGNPSEGYPEDLLERIAKAINFEEITKHQTGAWGDPWMYRDPKEDIRGTTVDLFSHKVPLINVDPATVGCRDPYALTST